MELKSIRLVVFFKEFAGVSVGEIERGKMTDREFLVIDEVDGTETLHETPDALFYNPQRHLKSELEILTRDCPDKPTSKTLVQIHEMPEGGTSKNLFGAVSLKYGDLCLTRAQIRKFYQSHRQWLEGEGWITLFLFKVGTEFFVAFVSADKGRNLLAGVQAFLQSGHHVWGDQG